MYKKALAILAIVTIATVAVADADWVGTYWGDASGNWEGTILEAQDPIRFVGVWIGENDESGTLFAYGDIVGTNWVFEDGDILDDANNVIGFWSGTFPIYQDAYVTGPWETEEGSGTWGGWRE